MIPLDQQGIAQGVAPLHLHVADIVQKHIHHSQSPGGAVAFLAVERVVVAADLVGAFDQQRARPAGRVGDAVARLGIDQPGQQFGHFGRGIKLTALFTGPGRKLADQILVGVADHIQVSDPAGPHIQFGVVEIIEQIFQPLVAIFGPAQGGFGVEVDVAKDALQLLPVGLFDLLQGDVDDLAQVGFVALLVERLKGRFLWQAKLLPVEPALNALRIPGKLLLILLIFIPPHIGDVAHEQHDQDIVFVFAGVYRAAKGVTRFPEDGIDFFLGDGLSHRLIVPWQGM